MNKGAGGNPNHSSLNFPLSKEYGVASRGYLLVLMIALMLLSGCGGPTIAPVRGRVTWNGKPVKDAMVTFSPRPKSEDDKEPGKPATGQSDADGNFVLSTYKPYDGAQVGMHQVTISLDDANPARAKRSTRMELEVKPGENELNIEIH